MKSWLWAWYTLHHNITNPFEGCVIYSHFRDFRLYVETHPTLFHPDFHVVVVEEDGRVVRKTVDTRSVVAGYVEGQK